MEYNIRNITPKTFDCGIGACPSIYDGLRELTSTEIAQGVEACSSVYNGGREVYLIIGRVVNPKEAGLEGKVGTNEALIEVPKPLIDEKRK